MKDVVRMNDGTWLVSVEEARAWSEILELREEIRNAGIAFGDRLFAVCTIGGYIVDVWQVDHWQSGLEYDNGAVGWSPDMYVPNG